MSISVKSSHLGSDKKKKNEQTKQPDTSPLASNIVKIRTSGELIAFRVNCFSPLRNVGRFIPEALNANYLRWLSHYPRPLYVRRQYALWALWHWLLQRVCCERVKLNLMPVLPNGEGVVLLCSVHLYSKGPPCFTVSGVVPSETMSKSFQFLTQTKFGSFRGGKEIIVDWGCSRSEPPLKV